MIYISVVSIYLSIYIETQSAVQNLLHNNLQYFHKFPNTKTSRHKFIMYPLHTRIKLEYFMTIRKIKIMKKEKKNGKQKPN